ncbi:hypothetical protein D3C72_1982770 [compost metagenome]
MTSRSDMPPISTLVSLAGAASTTPLAVRTRTLNASVPVDRPSLRAVETLIAMVLAPVSTMPRSVRPLMRKAPKKWPERSASSTTALPDAYVAVVAGAELLVAVLPVSAGSALER